MTTTCMHTHARSAHMEEQVTHAHTLSSSNRHAMSVYCKQRAHACCRCWRIVSTHALPEVGLHADLLWLGEGSKADTPTLTGLALGLHLVDAPAKGQAEKHDSHHLTSYSY